MRNRPRVKVPKTSGHCLSMSSLGFCSAVCTPIIGNMLVYENQYHITETYATYLSGALQNALGPVLGSSATAS